jgi:ribose/xylose/arabinose/galactoside ABC-type transport system permease subunit
LGGQRATFQDQRRVSRRTETWMLFVLNNGILLALIAEAVIFSIASPNIFFTVDTLVTVLRLASLAGILVACFTAALIAGQIDLSTPQVGGFVAVVFALMFQVGQWPLEVAFLLALLLGAGVGLLNSWLISRFGLPSLIVTLAVGTLCFGVAFLLVDAYSTSGTIPLVKPPLRSIINSEILGIPVSIYLMFLVYLAMYVLMNHTRIGAHLYAIGGNPQAARLNGINTGRLIALVLILTALATTVASILLSGRQLAAGPIISALGASSSGSLAAPASPLVAALFAGVALSGGEGRVERTLLGVLFLATLSIGMAIVNLPVYMRISIEGIAFVLAILLDSLRRRIETR